MSVIITRMSMPDDCFDCAMRRICDKGYANGWRIDKRDDNCKLKSIQGLIEEINKKDFDFGDYYDHTDTIIEMVVKCIKEYCEVEE